MPRRQHFFYVGTNHHQNVPACTTVGTLRHFFVPRRRHFPLRRVRWNPLMAIVCREEGNSSHRGVPAIHWAHLPPLQQPLRMSIVLNSTKLLNWAHISLTERYRYGVAVPNVLQELKHTKILRSNQLEQ